MIHSNAENEAWWDRKSHAARDELFDRILDKAENWDYRTRVIRCRERAQKGIMPDAQELEMLRKWER